MLSVGPAHAQKKKVEPIESYSATAIASGQAGVSGTARIQIVINRWSTEEEREKITAAMKEQDEMGIVRTLSSFEPVGTIREITRMSYDLRYAREVREGGRRTIILGTDRPVEVAEMAFNTRSSRHNVSIIQLDVDDQGVGQGILAAGVRIRYNEQKNQIEMEDYTFQPLDLRNVKRDKPKKKK